MELENVIVTECKKIEGQIFWGATLSDGRKVTVWDKDIAASVMGNINIQCQAFVKQQGTNWNIRKFTGVNPPIVIQGEAAPVAAPIVQQAAPVAPAATVTQPTPEEFMPADGLSVNAKSSVKLKKMIKGLSWEIKVVTGEEMIIPVLTMSAIAQHKILCAEFPVVEDGS